jgi:outer membrane protein TolC
MRSGWSWRAPVAVPIAAVAVLVGCAAPRPPLGTPAERIEAARQVAPDAVAAALATLDEGPFTAARAVQRALCVNPDVLACEHDVRVARAEARVAGDGRDPELRGGYSDGDEDQTSSQFGVETNLVPATGLRYLAATNSSYGTQSTDSERYSVALRFFPRNPWERGAAVSAGRARWHAAEARLRQFAVDVALETCRMYEVLRFMSADVANIEEIAAIQRDLVAQTDELARAGRITASESLRARQRYLAAVSDLSRGRRDLEDARLALARWLNVGTGEVNPVMDWAPALPDTNLLAGASDPLTYAALSNRADVAALGWDTRAAWHAYREARAMLWPWFSYVQPGYAWSDQSSSGGSTSRETDLTAGSQRLGSTYRTQDSESEEWRIDAGITLPVFSWIGHEDDLRKAEYEKAQAAEARAVLDLPGRVESQVAKVRLIEAQSREYGRETEAVTAELTRLLADTAETADIAPEDRARVREELVQSLRLAAQTAHSLNMAAIDLHAALGTLPVPTVELPERNW